MGARPALGWLAQDNAVLPLPKVRGSIDNDVAQLSRRLTGRYEITMATRPHPDHGRVPMIQDDIRYVRLDVARDEARGGRIHRLNQLQRALKRPDLPYTGRRSYFRGYARQAAEAFAAADVDLVHTHNYSQWIPELRRGLPNAAIVLQMHCEWLIEIPEREARRRIEAADRVVGVSTEVVRLIRERYPDLADRVEVLPNGIDVREFPGKAAILAERGSEVEAMRARLGVGEGPVLLSVGRISPEKGLHHVIEALPSILDAVPDLTVLMCGPFAGLRSPLPTAERREMIGHPEWRARYADWLRKTAEPFGDRVLFPGRIPAADLPVLFAMADVAMQPSMFEALPLSVAEAMASELPVVATRTGGMLDLMVDGETGLQTEFGDSPALAEAIVSLLRDPDRASAMGRAGRKRIENAFTWDQAADKLDGIYRRLLAAGG